MKQKKLLILTFSQLKQIFNQELPELVEIAEKSTTVEDFKAELLTFSETCDIKILRRRRGSKFDSYSIMMDSMSMNCLRDRICQYRLFDCSTSF